MLILEVVYNHKRPVTETFTPFKHDNHSITLHYHREAWIPEDGEHSECEYITWYYRYKIQAFLAYCIFRLVTRPWKVVKEDRS